MYIVEDTLDDLLREVFQRLLDKGHHVDGNKKGANTELLGVLLELRKPRFRLSRTETKGTLFSCLGETLWYLAKSNKLAFIEYYIRNYGRFSDDGRTIWGAYGPRMFNKKGRIDQVANVIANLKERPPTRKAVIQLFDAEDLVKEHKDVPCTCTLQFFVRDKLLHLVTYMRSNDAFLGLPHDIFAFTFLQEIVARSVGVEMGTYKHAAGSLHLYDEHLSKAKTFLREGWQSRISMPEMPVEDPRPHIAKVLKAEANIRGGRDPKVEGLRLPPYWADLVRLLQVYARKRDGRRFKTLRKQLSSDVYAAYIDKRSQARRRRGKVRSQ